MTRDLRSFAAVIAVVAARALPANAEPAPQLRVDLALSAVTADHMRDGATRRTLAEYYDEKIVPLDHRDWSSSESASTLTASWQAHPRLALTGRLPLVHSVTHGTFVPMGMRIPERFDRTALGDIGLGASGTLVSIDVGGNTLIPGAAAGIDLPTGRTGNFDAHDAATGSRALGISGQLQAVLARGDETHVGASVGLLWRQDRGTTQPSSVVVFGELGGRHRLGPVELSLAVLFHRCNLSAPQSSYPDIGATAPTTGEVAQLDLSIAPGIALPLDSFRIELAARAPRLADGMSEVSTGIGLLTRNDLAPTWPPVTLTLSYLR